MTFKTDLANLSRRGALTGIGVGAAASMFALAGCKPKAPTTVGTGKLIKLGFIALTDSSPLIIAKEKGIFAKYGLNVEVAKQASWAATRDNLVLGQAGGGIDGAHILSPLPYLMTTGTATNGTPVPMQILARLNTNGQAISVSTAMAALHPGLDAAPLKAKFAEMKAGGTMAKVAMTFRGGTHDLWVRYWLAAAGINPDSDCETIIIPPPQMVANMKAGTQDVFCVGEPWNAQTVSQAIGATAAVTSEIWMNHPEKALGMRKDWIDANEQDAIALTAAIIEAQKWCDGNREEMCGIVSGRQYINVPLNDILPRLTGTIDYGNGRKVEHSDQVMKFFADDASFPFKSHDKWFVTENIRWGNLPAETDIGALVDSVNRADIWRKAADSLGVKAPASDSRGIETFFDGKSFDPENPAAYLASLAIKKA